MCNQENERNIIRIEDNGRGIVSASNPVTNGRGTKQSLDLAKQLGGEFKRYSNPKGTVCELSWFSS